MNRGRHSDGYTIVETMIVIAVSAALFIATAAMIGGRQGREEFAKASREFEIDMQNIANDVATGYYTYSTDSSGRYPRCNANDTNISISTINTSQQGTNKECIFIGRSIHVRSGIDDTADQYTIYTLVGRSQFNGTDVSNLTDSGVKVLTTGSNEFTENKRNPAYRISCVLYATVSLETANNTPCISGPKAPAPSSALVRTDTLTFMTTFVGINASSGNRESGDTQVDLLVRTPTSVVAGGRNSGQVIPELNGYTSTNVIRPAGGVYICLQSNGSDQFALLRIGGNGSKYASDMTINPGRCE